MIVNLRLYKGMWTLHRKTTSTSIDFPGDPEFLVEAASKRGITIIDTTHMPSQSAGTDHETLIVEIIDKFVDDADVKLRRLSVHKHGCVYEHGDLQFMAIQPHVLNDILNLKDYPEYLSFIIHGSE